MLSRAVAYVKAHADHFMISLGVSLVVAILTNVIMHYLPWMLHSLHVPSEIVHLFTGK